jgi:peptide/nickel transport system ATP-binding protein
VTQAPLLEVRGLCKDYPMADGLFRSTARRVLRDVTFRVDHAEIVALVGESGSGKSTVARLVARLMPPTEGQILIDGSDVLKSEPRRASLAYRKRVQMIFQDPFGSLNPAHNIAYHIERPLLRHGLAKRGPGLEARVHELLESVGLSPAADVSAKRPDELSGGQRQRVAIARALAVEPAFIIADEPTSMLDVSLRIGVLNLMQDLRRERGVSILLITHDLASARYLADRIIVMKAGEIVEQGPSDDLLSNPQHAYTQRLLAAVPTGCAEASAAAMKERSASDPPPSDPPPATPSNQVSYQEITPCPP